MLRYFSKAVTIKSFTPYALAVLFLLIASSSQPVFSRPKLYPDIAYVIRIDPSDLSGFNVEMRVRGAGNTVRLAMASHPEYDDRYWRYVENLSAESRGVACKVTREEDALWRVDVKGGELFVKYRIHLPQQTTNTRDAWKPFLSETGGLVGDLHSLMYVVGSTNAPARVTLDIPHDWSIASGLDATNDPQTFAASSVELLLDSPIVIGHFRRWDFAVNNVEHTVVYLSQPNTTSFNADAFVGGIRQIATEALKLFGKPPYNHYTFIYQDGAEGALEHLNSVTIGAQSRNLAQGLANVFQTTSHEYFHTWNLMHVRPLERVGVRYRHAEPTTVLWWSEGVTIYFSDLLLRRAHLPVPEATRAAHLENKIASYLLTPGYARISPERVSLTSDDPLALGDDFASVYLQGELLGSMLDLMIRDATRGRRTLDDVMRLLSDRFTPERGITDFDIERAMHDVCRCNAHSFFDAYVRNAHPIDFDRYLRAIGLHLNVSWSPALDSHGQPAPDLRIYPLPTMEAGELRLRLTNPNSAWGRAGLHTGDRLISLDGQPVKTFGGLRARLSQLHIGQTVRLEVMRNGAVIKVTVPLTGYDRPTVRLQENADATPAQLRLRAQWADGQP